MNCYVFVFVVTLRCVHMARILALVPYKADSHFPIFDVLLTELASRGHELVVVSHFPRKTAMGNYTDISILGSMPGLTNKVTFELDSARLLFPPMRMFNDTTICCELVFKHENVQKLVNSKETFDLIITEIFGSDCFLAFIHKFGAPYVGVMTSIPYPWSNFRVGNPDNPAFVPNYFLPYTDKMGFFERLKNTVYLLASNFGHYYFTEIQTQRIATSYLSENIPPLSDIAKNVSLILVNSYFGLHYPRPNVPAFVEVGGIHIKRKAQLIPEGIQKFLDDAENGVIYFSMGSMVKSETLNPVKLKAFLDAFSEIPQRVIWKFGENNITKLPGNVRTYKWMPQRAILEHPKVRVFITHGGMMGTQEAVYAGVPMLGIPLFADQMQNINNYVHKGIALQIDFDSITKHEVLESLRKLVNEPRYWNRAQEMSRIFKDRPQTPLETAIFWIEYVIRHQGAYHLRSAALNLSIYQYLLLDVLLVISLITTLISFLLYLAAASTINFICKRQNALSPSCSTSYPNRSKRSSMKKRVWD